MKTLTLREKKTCGRCKEVHTNDNLNIYKHPAEPEERAVRVCFFCDHNTGIATKNGTMGVKRGEQAPTVTREEDRLEGELELLEIHMHYAREALRGVRLMLNTELTRYKDEPWAKRVMDTEGL